ncbi:MAG: short chain dehydrogenase [Prolixibacteraceae bacterium]|nr:short chain dehydrogenase [Prolixibacteraceae bacterium]MBN2774579.1 short chain dehydrogenase [Prolixibacteraceae bacterium]
MRILIIGGYGTIGKKVADYFSSKYETIISGRTQGDYPVDLANESSIKNLFARIGKVDAIINIAGQVKWMDFEKMSEEDFYVGIRNKMMGQVNLVRIGKDYLNPKGSITLTTGILADDPVQGTTGAALVNGGIHSFVHAVKDELGNGIRINVVSPGLVEDSFEKIGHLFPGRRVIPMKEVVNGYRRSVEDNKTGEIIRIY